MALSGTSRAPPAGPDGARISRNLRSVLEFAAKCPDGELGFVPRRRIERIAPCWFLLRAASARWKTGRPV
jgi:hypothetical protein